MRKLLINAFFIFCSTNVFCQNVGIGTISPTEKLEVAGKIKITTTGYGLIHADSITRIGTFIDGGAGWFGTFSNHPLLFFTHDSSDASLAISNTGNVSIGSNAANTSAKLDVTSTTQGFLPPRMTAAQRNAISAPAEGLLIYQTDSITGIYLFSGGSWLNIKPAPAAHFIGENYGGGIVFYIYDNGQHGLIAATADQSTGVPWYNGTYKYTGTTGDGLNAGAMNTAMIVATQTGDNQTGNFAAKVCADYSVSVGDVTYGDWYLPSKYELSLLHSQKSVVGGFSNVYYWSSTESGSETVSAQFFLNGFQNIVNKVLSYNVRAIRAF